MKKQPQELEQIVSLLTRLVGEISPIEEEFSLFVGEGDFRPRIEYFHDAIRAYTSGDNKHREDGGRLVIEQLAYDMECLRYIHKMPMAPFKPQGNMKSPRVDVVNLDQNLVAQAKRMERAVREELVNHYQHYAVLFAALLKPIADADYYDRSDELNHGVADVSGIIAQFEAQLKGKGDKEILMQLILHLEHETLRKELLAFVQHPKSAQKDQIQKMITYLKGDIKKKDAVLKTIDKAHESYAMNQLAVYENSRDLLKKMAGKGMNLVGQFVENSIRDTQTGRGR